MSVKKLILLVVLVLVTASVIGGIVNGPGEIIVHEKRSYLNGHPAKIVHGLGKKIKRIDSIQISEVKSNIEKCQAFKCK